MGVQKGVLDTPGESHQESQEAISLRSDETYCDYCLNYNRSENQERCQAVTILIDDLSDKQGPQYFSEAKRDQSQDAFHHLAVRVNRVY